MAETTLPSVRGLEKLLIFSLLLASASVTGGLVGFMLGVILILLPDASGGSTLIVGLLGAAIIADLSNLVAGKPQPFTLGRQVPREWRDLLNPRLVAGLYGARLGVGPLTILSTWMWWAGSLAAATLGVWTSVLFGSLFAAARVVSMALVAGRADHASHEQVFGQLRRVRKPTWGGLNLVAGLGCLALVLGACTGGGNGSEAGDAQVTTTSFLQATSKATVSPNTSSSSVSQEAPSVTALPNPEIQSSVIGAIPLNDPDIPNPDPLEADDLAGSLVAEVAQFSRIDQPEADRFLDLEAASASQPDPTEEGPLLETRGFRGGWTRAFRNDTQDVIVATVYDFANESEAAYYREDGLITLGGFGAEFFEVPQLPEARGFRTESSDGIGPIVTWGLTFTQENQWYLIYLLGDPQTATVEVLVQAVSEQYQHLGIDTGTD